MSKPKVNSGFGRESGARAAKAAKPQRVQLRSGFQAATSGLNTSGSRRTVPHDTTTSPSATGSDIKLQKAGITSGTGKRGKRMY